MAMKKSIYIILIITSLIYSCTEDFDVELDSTYSRIVIQGSINDELKNHMIFVSKSANYFDNSAAPKVTGATVTISDGYTIFPLTEIEEGLYQTDSIAGEAGKTYTLSVDIEGIEYKANCFMNYCPEMDSIKFGFYDDENYDGKRDTVLNVLLYALEPPTPNNFYLWDVYKNGVLDSDTLHEKIVSDDEFVNGNYISRYPVQYVEAGLNDTITLEMQAITKEFYEYFYQVMEVTVWNMGPLSGPPANPVGNIYEVVDNKNDNDNPLGFFLAYTTHRITEIVPPKKNWIELEGY